LLSLIVHFDFLILHKFITTEKFGFGTFYYNIHIMAKLAKDTKAHTQVLQYLPLLPVLNKITPGYRVTTCLENLESQLI